MVIKVGGEQKCVITLNKSGDILVIMKRVIKRYHKMAKVLKEYGPFSAELAGVAALGFLFAVVFL